MKTNVTRHKIKKWTFKIFFYASIFIAILTIPVIGQCECKTNRFWANKDYLDVVLFSGFALLLIQFFVFSADFVKDIFKRLTNRPTDSIHLKIYFLSILIGFLWTMLVLKYISDGECNILTGPSDSGMTIALFVATAINYWKLKVIERE
jgi:hypothetical protein